MKDGNKTCRLQVETNDEKSPDLKKLDGATPIPTPATTASTATNFSFDSPNVGNDNDSADHFNESNRLLERDNASIGGGFASITTSSDAYSPLAKTTKQDSQEGTREMPQPKVTEEMEVRERVVHKRKRSLVENHYKLSAINKYYGSTAKKGKDEND